MAQQTRHSVRTLRDERPDISYFGQALHLYEAAEAIDPDHPDVLLCLARANHDLENYGTTRRAYRRLQQIAPSLAGQVAYLGIRGEEAERAAELGGAGDFIFWSDEGREE